jgi:hypothetical protein
MNMNNIANEGMYRAMYLYLRHEDDLRLMFNSHYKYL